MDRECVKQKMGKITQLGEIQRIVYMWARYSGTRCSEGKKYTGVDISNLIERLKAYNKNPEKFDWNEGEVPDGV